MTFEPGARVLERYIVEETLGKGAMGQVYLARHELLEMPVAIKVLLTDDHGDLRERFAREAKLMARVRHVNVVQIIDYGFLPDGAPCIVMEFLDGRELSEAKRPARWRRASECVAQILAGLAAVHAAGILHRDLKPSNVVMVGGRGRVAKLVDFGIARPASRSEMRLTQTGMLIGTPAFMSPEQLLGSSNVTAATDVYSAGLILYELLQGTLPFGESMNSVMKRLRHDVPPPTPTNLRPPWPDALTQLVMDMLATEPDARPTTLDAQARLRTLLTDRGPNTTSPASAALKERAVERPARDLGERGTEQGVDPRDVSGETRPGHAPLSSRRDIETARTLDAVRPANSLNGVGDLAPRESLPEEPDGEAQVRVIVVLKIPSSRLRSKQERAWLAGLLGPSGRGFTMGPQLWIALLRAHHDDVAEALATQVVAQVEGRYGTLAEVGWSRVDEEFSLTGAMLSGASPLPAVLVELIGRVHG